MYGSLDISTSGMIAQRTRFQVAAANVANADAVRDSRGNINPYRRRMAMFAPGDPGASTRFGRAMGVHIASIELDPAPAVPRQYDPDHPDAYKSGPYKGYVPTTNVNPITERVNAMEAERAYEANVAAAEATKSMIAQALRLLA